jgi:hypothetical protein
MIKNVFKIILIFSLPLISFSQIGGTNTYDFLTLTNSARSASMGGDLISIQDADLNLTFENPSLLVAENDNQMVFNYVNYFSDINFGYVSYAKNYSKLGTFATGMHYLNYGTFDRADETGEILGTFKAAEYSLNLLYAIPIDTLLNFGVNLKTIYSQLDTYISIGLALDVGITYFNKQHDLLLTALVKNVGTQITTYTKSNYEPLPFDLQLGVSKKFTHAPFRISVVAHQLYKYGLTYYNAIDPANIPDPITNEVVKKNVYENNGDKILRHFIFGVEITPIKSFFIRAGYNHQRRQELKLFSANTFSGISWGVGVRIYKFNFSYGNAVYHAAGSSHHFSLTTNFSDFERKEAKINVN